MPTRAAQHVEANRNAAERRLLDWLAIPSVSTDAAHAGDIARAAEWVRTHLAASGLDARIMPTAGHPVVYAESLTSGGPTVLFYGHYDVQPPDPVEKWDTPPFEPTVHDGKVYARGACDDKGQVACILEALRAWHDAGESFPCNVKVLIEGEEEIGSKHLPAFLEQHKDLLAADVCIVSDTSMWQTPTGPVPAICYALRGLVYFDVQLHGPTRDLHSGVYGGTLANPATLLTRILGKLFDDRNHITIPGFYDDVDPVTPEEEKHWEKLDFDERAWLGEVGSQPFGEAGFSTLQRKWTRPCCDVNGLYGGFMQHGAKTVIPSFAGAKVSFRIPASMDPRKVAKQFTDWLHTHDMGGCTWQLTNHGEAFPCATPIDSPWIAATSRAVEAVTGQPAALIREGATIPIVADFQRVLGLHTVLLGFGLNGDLIHSPNEHFALDRFHLGTRVHARLLNEIAAV